MHGSVTPRTLASLLIACAVASAMAAPDDPTLLGCWRSQHVQVTLADQSRRDQNGDCVTEYDGSKARSRCHSNTGNTEVLSSYEVIEPGRLRVTMLDGVPEKAKGTTSELRYSLQDGWLLIERPLAGPAPAGSPGKQPVSMKSVSVRVRGTGTESADCRPRGANPLRIGRTPPSSLVLTVPAGWEPYLVDPAADKHLGPAVSSSFFIGAFVPKGARTEPRPSHMVLVVDDVRPGPVPVRAAEFAAVKQRFAAELQPDKLLCDQPDRACGSLSMPNKTQVYTELLKVNGRVAMVTGAVAESEAVSLETLRKSVQSFVEQLRADNAR
jgi:hypothetical protein